MRPIAEGALMVAPTDREATGTMTVVSIAADFWAWGRALSFVFPEELPWVPKGLAQEGGWLKNVAACVGLMKYQDRGACGCPPKCLIIVEPNILTEEALPLLFLHYSQYAFSWHNSIYRYLFA